MRTLSFELVPDPGSFTPLQLKPTVLLATCFNASERWSRAYGVPLQVAIRDLQIAFVVRVARLRYLASFVHANVDCLNVTATRCSLRDGAQLELRAFFEPRPKHRVAEVSLCLVPLSLSEGEGDMAGLPAPMPPAYLEQFLPSERFSQPYPSPFPGVVREIAESEDLLASHEQPLSIHRQHCGFVDQWYFVEAANFAATSRERMVLQHGARIPALRRGLSLPVREMDMLFLRPFYLFDQGKVRTRAFRGPGGLTFIHELIKDDPTEPHALVVERF